MTGDNKRINWLRPILRLMNRRILANYEQITPLAGIVLLLTTRGRRSGLPRTTPLQYEVMDGYYTLAASWGENCDWMLNVEADPQVEIQVGREHYRGMAEIAHDPIRIADLLELKIKSKPPIIWVMRRQDMERFASRKVMVVIKLD